MTQAKPVLTCAPARCWETWLLSPETSGFEFLVVPAPFRWAQQILEIPTSSLQSWDCTSGPSLVVRVISVRPQLVFLKHYGFGGPLEGLCGELTKSEHPQTDYHHLRFAPPPLPVHPEVP